MPFTTCDRTKKVDIRMGSGQAGMEPRTLVQNFDEMVKKYGDRPALHQKVIGKGEKAVDTPWTTWTWSEYRNNADSFAKALISIGFEKHDVINILGFNAPEWFFSSFGAILAGGIGAGIYATNGEESCKYISDHSEAKVVVVEGIKQLEKYYDIASDLTNLKALVVYGSDTVPDDAKDKTSIPVYSFEEFLKLGTSVLDEDLKSRSDAVEASEVSTLIYTSGTTGPPKAAMITHDNLTWTSSTMLSYAFPKPLGPDDHFISFLPLSHIAAQALDMHCAMASGAQVWFAQPDALKGSLGATLKEVRPTVFFGVPRVWEKIYDKMQMVAKATTGIKKKIGSWAKSKSTEHWESHQFGGSMKSPTFYGLSSKILLKIHCALGLDRCMLCLVSAAPIDVKILKYFASINIPIVECFGQSECTGPHLSNTLTDWKIGSCGRPLPGTVTKIDPETGELQYSGRHIFAGYMGMEDITNEAVDSEGFLHSGDVVKIDECNREGMEGPSGFVTITGRIKEIIITAGGENIPPVLIEENIKDALPALSNCMVIGDKRKFLSILFCLQVEIDEEGVPSNKLTGLSLDTSKKIGSKAITSDDAKMCELWKAHLDEGLKVANSKATSRAQNVAKWTLHTTDFTEKTGELTPTLKLKRKVTEEIHDTIIEAMYA